MSIHMLRDEKGKEFYPAIIPSAIIGDINALKISLNSISGTSAANVQEALEDLINTVKIAGGG